MQRSKAPCCKAPSFSSRTSCWDPRPTCGRSSTATRRSWTQSSLPSTAFRPPASGFAQVQLPPSSGRAGILGQAGVIAGHSQADRSSPTRRGLFILESFLCTTPPPPPAGVNTVFPAIPRHGAPEAGSASRECVVRWCHGFFDPSGLAMEHFDPIGQYRATENGLAIDATGNLERLSLRRRSAARRRVAPRADGA